MSQLSKSELSLKEEGTKPAKKRTSDTEELSKEYKKPRKSLKQLTLVPAKEKLEVTNSTAPTKSCPPIPIDVGTRVMDMLERIIARQDRAQECIDHLIGLCLQEEPDDSFEGLEPLATKSKRL